MAPRDVKRLAVVGYGKIAPKHLEVLRALGAEIVASVNRSEAGREKARTEGGIGHTYASIAEMMGVERLDGVLCLPSYPQMFAAANEVLAYGVPTLLEKPPGTSLAELDTLLATAAKHGTPALIGLNRRHYSVVTKAIEDAGGVERIQSVFVDWSEDPVHVSKRMSPEGVAKLTFGNTLHGLDLITTLAGPIPSPSIVVRDFGEPFRWTMAFQGLSSRGALVSFNSTWGSPGKWRVAFCTDDRRYLFAPLESCTVQERGKDDRVIEPSDDDKRFKAGFMPQARVFLDVIETRRVPAAFELASARPAMELAEALTQAIFAARERRG
ncbi:Gfo/Idh/MocA family oxidoreductase [Myxococcota bacterium]|nr:Gfo/Idh/MocA family oxidoreductase [Myxococcota bacterium]